MIPKKAAHSDFLRKAGFGNDSIYKELAFNDNAEIVTIRSGVGCVIDLYFIDSAPYRCGAYTQEIRFRDSLSKGYA